MRFNSKDPTVMKIIAILLATVVFLFVSYENSQSDDVGGVGGTSFTTNEVIPDVPVKPIVESDQYFVSGVPDTVSLELSGSQALLTQTIVTQNYEVVTPNINELGEGRHEIKLELEGVSDGLKYSISPDTVTVVVEERLTDSYTITPELDVDEYIADGYAVDTIDLSEDTVEISGSASTIENIDRVLAVIQPEENEFTNDFSSVANLLVLDENDQPLDINISPKQVQVDVTVEGTSSEVPIKLVQSGKPVQGYSYKLSIAKDQPQSITVSGEADVVNSFKSYPIEVDISGVTQTTSRTVPIIHRDGVDEINMSEIEVKIDVTDETNKDEVNTSSSILNFKSH